MTKKEFDKLSKALTFKASEIMKGKGPEYTDSSEDVLENFKSTGERLNISALKVWGIFMDKQCSSVFAHVNNCALKESEPIDSRFADIINYCHLGLALFKERKK
jgi:hypothetical protein